MYHIEASKETMNEGLLLIKGTSTTPSTTTSTTASTTTGTKATAASGGSKLAECYEREELLEHWLKVSSSVCIVYCIVVVVYV